MLIIYQYIIVNNVVNNIIFKYKQNKQSIMNSQNLFKSTDFSYFNVMNQNK